MGTDMKPKFVLFYSILIAFSAVKVWAANCALSLEKNPGMAPVHQISKISLAADWKDADLPVGYWFLPTLNRDVYAAYGEIRRVLNHLHERGRSIVIRTGEKENSTRFSGKIESTDLKIGRGDLKFSFSGGTAIVGDHHDFQRKLSRSEMTHGRGDQYRSGGWEFEYREITGIFILPTVEIPSSAQVLRNPESIHEIERGLRHARLEAGPDARQMIVSANYTGRPQIDAGPGYQVPAIGGFAEKDLPLRILQTLVSPWTKSKILRYGGRLKDGRDIIVELACGPVPGSQLWAKFSITWRERPWTPLIEIANVQLSQPAAGCGWGIWGTIQ